MTLLMVAVAAVVTATRPPVIEPAWQGPANLGLYYPALAQRMEISGWGRVRCDVNDVGHAANCIVVGESPQDYGFGQAALRVVKLGLFGPTVTGQSPFGRTIYKKIGFNAGKRQVVLWTKEPSAHDISQARPPSAEPFGMADVVCRTVAADGSLGQCTVQSESPANEGFGAAALSLTGRYRTAAPSHSVTKISTWVIWQDPSSTIVPAGMSLDLTKSPPAMTPMATIDSGQSTRESRVASGVFSRTPTASEIEAARPGGQVVTASVVLTCDASGDGTLAACSGRSYGTSDGRYLQAALGLAPLFRVSPATLQAIAERPAALVHVNFEP
jgi:TonB family protein